ncbi:STAS domain-containing protein [Actinoallomurus vinaceus]
MTAIPEGWERLAPALMTIVRVRPGAAPVVSVRGELDIACAGAFEDLVLEVIIRHGPDVVIDASRMSFCDARGLGALVRCANEAGRSGGRLTLTDPDHRLRRLLRIVHLDHLM